MGLPSISVRNAAIDYYFQPDECMFFDAGDVQALARWIDYAVEAPDDLAARRHRVLRARQRVLWSGEKKKYIEMLKELAGQEWKQQHAPATRERAK
jgi:hypothetical protein